MKLTFGDVSRLEEALAKEGHGVQVTDHDLVAWTTWFEEARGSIGLGSREAAVRLCKILKTSTASSERELALGALLTARKVLPTKPAKARFVLDFAIKRILDTRGATAQWSTIPLPPEIQDEARRLFDRAKDDISKTDDELRAAVNGFVERYGGDADVFGRLATNLQLLVDALEDPSLDRERKQIARAALSYFAIDRDAIPDDLGLVGLLDDAYIAHEAICRLRPERAGVLTVLDDVVNAWPFVSNIVLKHGSDKYRFSEFMLVNASLLLDKVTASAQKSVLVVPEPGPLAFVLGFIRALGEAHACAGQTFRKGDRVSSRENGAEFEFQGYGILSGSTFVECDRAQATHFRITKRDTKRSSQTPRIEFLTSFRLASNTRRTTLKAGIAKLDHGSVELGPLERLFGSDKPVVIGPDRGRVVVLGQLKETRALADELQLFGTPLREVLPVGHARLTESGIDEIPWTTKGPGGATMVTVVRTSADARHLVEDPSNRVIGVVGGVRPGTDDASNLAQLASTDTQVIALVRELDADSHATLEHAGFKFWIWDESWFGALHWPATSRQSNNAVARFERMVRTAGRSVISVERVELEGLTAAYEGARHLQRIAEDETDESLRAAAGNAMFAILTLCRTLTPLDEATAKYIAETIERFAADIHSNRAFWDQEKLEKASSTLGFLRRAKEALESNNPKFDLIQRWARTANSPHILCPARSRELLARTTGLEHLKNAVADGPEASDLIVPSWLGRDRMMRVLSRMGYRTTTLVLYPPEADWYEATKRRNDETKQRLQALSSKHVPFRRVRRAASEPPVASGLDDAMPEDLVSYALTARAKQTWSGSGDDTVPARLVHFAGGTWAAFTKWHALHRIESGETPDDSQLVEVRADELKPGDMLVLLRGSDRDVLRSEVDKRVPPGTREVASEWRHALRRYQERGHSIIALGAALAAVGCKRTSATLREWIEDSRVIQPLRGAEEIDLILQATKDERLRKRLDECKLAAQTLRRLHVLVAREMAAEVRRKASQYLDSGTAPSELVNVDGRLVLVAVEVVDSNILDVPASFVNRLQEAPWRG